MILNMVTGMEEIRKNSCVDMQCFPKLHGLWKSVSHINRYEEEMDEKKNDFDAFVFSNIPFMSFIIHTFYLKNRRDNLTLSLIAEVNQLSHIDEYLYKWILSGKSDHLLYDNAEDLYYWSIEKAFRKVKLVKKFTNEDYPLIEEKLKQLIPLTYEILKRNDINQKIDLKLMEEKIGQFKSFFSLISIIKFYSTEDELVFKEFDLLLFNLFSRENDSNFSAVSSTKRAFNRILELYFLKIRSEDIYLNDVSVNEPVKTDFIENRDEDINVLNANPVSNDESLLSMNEAAVQILRVNKRPLTSQEIWRTIENNKLCKTAGLTPEKTLNTMMLKYCKGIHLTQEYTEKLFYKAGPSCYGLLEWLSNDEIKTLEINPDETTIDNFNQEQISNNESVNNSVSKLNQKDAGTRDYELNKKLTYVDAAFMILKNENRCMKLQDIFKIIINEKLVETNGKTPERTLSTLILQACLNVTMSQESKSKKFYRAGPQLFGLLEWLTKEEIDFMNINPDAFYTDEIRYKRNDTFNVNSSYSFDKSLSTDYITYSSEDIVNKFENNDSIKYTQIESGNINDNNNFQSNKAIELEQLLPLMSTRSYNVCLENNLLSLTDIIDYYKKNGSFSSLEKIGAKSNNELIKLCLSKNNSSNVDEVFYQENNQINNSIMFTLNYLYNKKLISIRSYNVCLENNLLSLNDIIDYYKKNRSFFKLKKIGGKSNKELVNLCKFEKKIDNDDIQIYDSIKTIDAVVLKKLSNYLDILINNLSDRTRAVIYKTLNNEIDLIKYLDTFYQKPILEIKRVYSIGMKSADEIIQLNQKLSFLTTCIENNQIKLLKVANFICQDITKSNTDFHEYLSENQFNIFLFFQKEILSDKYFDNKQLYVLQKYSGYYKEETETLEKIGIHLHITRERVRQIFFKSVKILNNLINIFSFELLHSLFLHYLPADNYDYIIINDSYTEKFHDFNNKDFSNMFFGTVISSVFSDMFVFYNKYIDISDSALLLLISKDIISVLNLNDLINDLVLKLSNVTENYTIPLDAYIYKYIPNKSIDMELFGRIKRFIVFIVNNTFNLYIDEENLIHVNRNTKKLLWEYVYDVLLQIGYPSTINRIKQKLTELDFSKNHKLTEHNIRAIINRFPDKFIYIRGGNVRKSRYGLKIWEDDSDNIRGGTIREMVYDELNKADRPLHIDELAERIAVYRKISGKNIFGNMIASNYEDIEVYPYTFIGLKNKTYNKNYRGNKFPPIFKKIVKNYFLKSQSLNMDRLYAYLTGKYNLNYDMVVLVCNYLIKEIK